MEVCVVGLFGLLIVSGSHCTSSGKVHHSFTISHQSPSAQLFSIAIPLKQMENLEQSSASGNIVGFETSSTGGHSREILQFASSGSMQFLLTGLKCNPVENLLY